MLFFQYCNRYDGNHTFDQNLRIGLVRELILQVTVTNKANDHAYYSKLLVKYPRSLGYLRTGDVSRLKDNYWCLYHREVRERSEVSKFISIVFINFMRENTPYFLGSIFLQDMVIYSHSNHFNMSFSPRPNVELLHETNQVKLMKSSTSGSVRMRLDRPTRSLRLLQKKTISGNVDLHKRRTEVINQTFVW